MADITQITDYFGDVTSPRLMEQFKEFGAPNFNALNRAASERMDLLERVLFEVRDKFWLSTAEGVQLDILGALFSAERDGRDDDDFRAVIETLAMTSLSGTPNEITTILKYRYPDWTEMDFVPVYPAKFSIVTDAEITQAELEEIAPAGVGARPGCYLVDSPVHNYIVLNNGEKILMYSGCGSGPPVPPPPLDFYVDQEDISMMTLDGSTYTTYQLDVFEEGTTTPATGISWDSSNPAVATVSPTGLVTAIGTGDVSIIASRNGAEQGCDVSVYATVPTSSVLETLRGGAQATTKDTLFNGSATTQDIYYIYAEMDYYVTNVSETFLPIAAYSFSGLYEFRPLASGGHPACTYGTSKYTSNYAFPAVGEFHKFTMLANYNSPVYINGTNWGNSSSSSAKYAVPFDYMHWLVTLPDQIIRKCTRFSKHNTGLSSPGTVPTDNNLLMVVIPQNYIRYRVTPERPDIKTVIPNIGTGADVDYGFTCVDTCPSWFNV